MNAIKVVASLIGFLVVLFIARVIHLTTPIWEKIQNSPWWISLIVAGVFISGFLSFKYSQEDKEMEQRWIEEEGERIMEPIRSRRENRLTND